LTPEERLNRLERIALLFAKTGFRTRNKVAEHEVSIKALINAQMLNEDRFAKLAEAQAHSDKRLDALIDIVRERFNGDSHSDS